jgi:hypothetical protein
VSLKKKREANEPPKGGVSGLTDLSVDGAMEEPEGMLIPREGKLRRTNFILGESENKFEGKGPYNLPPFILPYFVKVSRLRN